MSLLKDILADSKKRDAPETELQTENLSKKSKDIYHQLDELLDSIKFKYYDMNELIDGEFEAILPIQTALERDGVVILKNAVSPAFCENTAQFTVGKVIHKMFKWQLSETERTNVLHQGSFAIDHKRNCKDLGHGNASFGFILKHLRSSYPTVDIGGEKIELDLNSSYYDVNLYLLEKHPFIFGLLYALYGPRCEVSRDALKDVLSSSPKPKAKTKPTLTKMHIDKYDSNVKERIQAMVMAEEDIDTGSVRLGFVPGANLPAVRELITQLEPSIYTRVGFNGIRDQKLVEVLSKHLVAAPYGALVIWKDGLPHAEANFVKAVDGVFRFRSYDESPNQHRTRFVVGVHQGRDKTQEETLLLANLARHGLTHAVYSSSNKKSAYGRANMVDSKTTQWKKPREVSPEEDQFIKDTVAKAVREVDELKWSKVIEKIGRFKAWMMGVDCFGPPERFENNPDIVKRWTYLHLVSTVHNNRQK